MHPGLQASNNPPRAKTAEMLSTVVLPFHPEWVAAYPARRLKELSVDFQIGGWRIPIPRVAWSLGGKHLVNVLKAFGDEYHEDVYQYDMVGGWGR